MTRAQHPLPSFRTQRGTPRLRASFARRIPLLFLSGLLLFLARPASAQVATGTPPFGSFAGGPDAINLGNLNARWDIPVLHKPGRGTNFTYDLTYDSSVWYPVTSNGTTTWQPVQNFGWSAQTQGTTGFLGFSVTDSCNGNCTITWTNYVYFDAFGTSHQFSGTITGQAGGGMGGGWTSGGGNFTSLAADGSGYTLYASITPVPSGSFTTVYTITTSSGVVTYPPSGPAPYQTTYPITVTDRNGNQITNDGSGHFYDTLSSSIPVLTISGSGTVSSPMKFTYTAPSGASPDYQMNYTNYTIATNFGVSGIGEYKSSAAVPLVSSIALPDGSQYSFNYEPTPGSCTPYSGTTCVTARVASVTLPTGGTISYLYYNSNNNFYICTTGNHGIFSDGSASCLQRTTPDGTWTHTRTQVSGSHWQTTISDPTTPTANQTVIDFQKDSATSPATNNFFETQRKIYQGSTSGSLLRQWITCYNGNTAGCTTTAVSSPITQQNVNDQYGASGLQCQHNSFYNSAGGLSEQDDYDYGSGTYGAVLRKVLITYASLPPNIAAFRKQVTVKNGAGTVVSQTNYNYDEGTPAATSGITQHTSVSGSRGNLTSINYPVSGLTSHFTYYDTGVPNTSQDVNGATTTYNYSSANNAYCNWAFPTSITEPYSFSRSFAWNCTGGVMTSLTDENSQVTSTTYNDAYFWRPASVRFPDGGQTSWTYNSQTSLTTTTKMNSSQNIVSTVVLDGLGRPSQTQLNDPEGNDYAVMTYDAVGRPYKAYNPTRCSPPTTNCGEATWGYTTTAYDALSRPTSVTLQDGSAVGASYTNNTVTTTDAAGKKRQTTADALGRLTQVLEDPSGVNYETDYGYDLNPAYSDPSET